MKNVLVTGGTGILGRRLIEELVTRDKSVNVRASYRKEGSGSAPRLEHERVEWLMGDLGDGEFCAKVCKGMDTVFHAAAFRKNVAYHKEHAPEVLSENVRMSLALVHGVRQTPSIKKLIVLSSANIALEQRIKEIATTPEYDGYVVGKLIAEMAWTALAGERSLPLLIARPVGIYGEHDRFDKDMNIIPSLLSQTRERKDSITLWGDGTQERPFLFVDDAVKSLLVLADNGVTGVQYIGPPEAVPVKRIAEMIRDLAAPKAKIICDTTKPSGRKSLDLPPLHPLLKNFAWTPLQTGLKKTFMAWSARQA